MKLISVITLALVATMQEAPALSRLRCHHGRSGKQIAFDNETLTWNYVAFSKQDMYGKYRLLAKAPNNHTEQTFTYNQGEPRDYTSPSAGGMLHSDKHPSVLEHPQSPRLESQERPHDVRAMRNRSRQAMVLQDWGQFGTLGWTPDRRASQYRLRWRCSGVVGHRS